MENTKYQKDNPNFLTRQDINVIPQQDAISTDNDDTEAIEQDNSIVEGTVNVKISSVDHIILDLNKISQVAFNSEKNNVLYQDSLKKIAMEKKGSNKEINTLVAINFDFNKLREKGLSIHGNEKLTPFDRIVLDAITTLFVDGQNKYISTNMIFRIMTGDKNRRISPNYAEEINNSIAKLMCSQIIIKANEEAIMYPKLKNFEYRSSILPAEMAKAKLNGTEIACIRVDREPPLYLYANHKNQISKIELALIQKPFEGKIHENKESLTILYYLVRRIIALKRNMSHIIKYETIYNELGYNDATRLKKFRIRECVKKILDAWKGLNFGDISFIGYTEKISEKKAHEIILIYKIIKIKKEN